MFSSADALAMTLVSVFVVLGLLAALALVIVNRQKPTTLPLLIATCLVVLVLAIVVVAPVNVPTLVGIPVALIGISLATLGGDPITRRVLDIATHGRIAETSDGGIIPGDSTASTHEGGKSDKPAQTVLRGGTTIGYLERLAAVIAIVAGFPEALAAVVALKGIGRFSELDSADARERFIIGSMTSLLWACAVGALIRLAIW